VYPAFLKSKHENRACSAGRASVPPTVAGGSPSVFRSRPAFENNTRRNVNAKRPANTRHARRTTSQTAGNRSRLTVSVRTRIKSFLGFSSTETVHGTRDFLLRSFRNFRCESYPGKDTIQRTADSYGCPRLIRTIRLNCFSVRKSIRPKYYARRTSVRRIRPVA